ncbi:MAG: alcohol dehydrogenase catalytic domain-containing protein [Polyangia bacterium]
MAKMRAVQVSRREGALELVERDIPEPRPGTVRIKVEACGICHSDAAVIQGMLPGITYPRVPGHEVAGVIDALGSGVVGWSAGQRVGVGWHGGYDGVCEACRRGDFFGCSTAQVTGASFDGGYADYMIAPTSALARIPTELSAIDAAPLLCAGVTTFNALRLSGARPGDLVAVLGLGGLGHLAVQFAAKMGFRTVAIARGKDKEAFAKKLGAVRYIDSQASDTAAELGKMGGARVIAATVTSGQAMSAVVAGLGLNGKLLVIGAGDAIEVAPYLLISGRRSIDGVYSGTAIDSEDTLAFSVMTNVRSMNEVFPFGQAVKAFERMASGGARFRVVLDMKR